MVTWGNFKSNTDAAFCVEALERALAISQPEIFNSDQGGQDASEAFTGRLKKAGIRISMDGRGRVFDNIFVERLWRTVKYEEVYLNHYESMPEAMVGMARYFRSYNREHPQTASTLNRHRSGLDNGEGFTEPSARAAFLWGGKLLHLGGSWIAA